MAITIDELKRNVFPGESGGDYNALFGYANRPGGQFAGTNLTDMTVDQALQFASPSGPYGQSVKGQIGRVATPMGAFQVVGSTLRAAKAGLGLTGSEKMTPELQDAIGMWIYQNQGPNAWEGWGKSGGGSSSVTTMSSKGGAKPMGLLDMQDEPQTFAERLKSQWQSGELKDRIALAANTLRMNPDQNLAAALQGRQQAREERATINKTAQWLALQGREDLAQAMLTGGLDGKTAATIALKPADKPNVIEVGGKLVDETGNVIYDPTNGAAPVLTPEQLTSLNTLRDDATTASSELGMMKDAWGNISTFYSNPGSVSDRGLVIAFAKILDPTSVVRESESAAIANSGSLSEGLRSMLLNTLSGGGNLPDNIRNEILSLSKGMYEAKIPGVQSRVDMLRETAKRAGLPEDLVFGGDFASPAQPPAVTRTTPPPTTPAPTTPAPATGGTGRTLTFDPVTGTLR